MSSRRRLAVLWLALVAFTLGVPLFAADACDEPCDIHCGDCAWCPLNGELTTANSSVAMSGADVHARPTRSASLVLARPLDHIPLPV